MEKQKQTPENEWHHNALVSLSHLATSMSTQYILGGKEQTVEYEQARANYLQLEADRKEHDKFIEPTYVDYHTLG